MSTCDLATLQAQACLNKFTCLDPKTREAVLLQLLCEIKTNGTGGNVLCFDSGIFTHDIPSQGAIIYEQPHGLGGTPTSIRAVVIPQPGNNLGFPADTEIDIDAWWQNDNARPGYSLSADATTIRLLAIDGVGPDITARYPDGASTTPPSINTYRIYAMRCT